MMRGVPIIVAMALALGTAPVADAREHGGWVVKERWVRAHESFLASEALQGRGSATRDEAIAATYVASQFESFGLKPAPGMDGYLQRAEIIRLRLNRAPRFAVEGALVEGATLLIGSTERIAGKLLVFEGSDPRKIPAADVVLVKNPTVQVRAAPGVKLLILRENDATRDLLTRIGGKPRLPSYLAGAAPRQGTTVVTLPAAAFDRLAARPGAEVSLALDLVKDSAITTNAIGYIAGREPKAGTVLYSAHLDHLGPRPDGTVMYGANDDASGTTAVLEIARALAAGHRPRRSILFVAYGSEEIGGFGSRYFAEHSPVPLASIVANIEFEMIGAQDPKLPAGSLMMTGFERSTLGEQLRSRGALISADPYPEQDFFRRSDNYQLALKGVVAHTISGWAVIPTYHTPDDTRDRLDIPFMTRAIQSLIGPARWLANSRYVPQWRPGGRPPSD